jgi:hypothetical protein
MPIDDSQEMALSCHLRPRAGQATISPGFCRTNEAVIVWSGDEKFSQLPNDFRTHGLPAMVPQVMCIAIDANATGTE